jgi:hypothetical protein
VDIYRRLAAQPRRLPPYLAGSLNNLAKSGLQRAGPAPGGPPATPSRRWTIYRRLAEPNPDAFLPYLAMSLNNLAAFYSELGRPQEALQHALEAVDHLPPPGRDQPRRLPPLPGREPQ